MSKITFIPEWIKVKEFDKNKYLHTYNLVKNLNTVCISANCPNRYECFSKNTATFMILGDVCTRNCKYCNISSGKPSGVDEEEPLKIASSIKKLNLDYAVITCVTRDDLDDGGASHFEKVFRKIKKVNPKCKIELLISDFNKNKNSINKIISLNPDVINHNIETCKDLFSLLRPKGDYLYSLRLLKFVKTINPNIKTKSGFMIGFGETKEQIKNTIIDLKKSGCDIITIGQYLQPTKKHFPVKKYYTSEEFNEIKNFVDNIKIVAGPLVRSSYNAGELN